MESVKNFLKDSPENSGIILAQISKKKVPDFFIPEGIPIGISHSLRFQKT